MIGAVNFFAKAAEAIKRQSGIVDSIAVTATGELDTIGAYGYCYDQAVRDAVDLIVASGKELIPDKHFELTAGAVERSLEVVLDEAGVELTKALIAYNDWRSFFPGEVILPETPAGRRDRMLRAMERGMVPGYPSRPLEEAA
jgi:hypothetical protein